MKNAVIRPYKTINDNEDIWYIVRCPECNAWDYGLQGRPEDIQSDAYTCDHCGEIYLIPVDWLDTVLGEYDLYKEAKEQVDALLKDMKKFGV